MFCPLYLSDDEQRWTAAISRSRNRGRVGNQHTYLFSTSTTIVSAASMGSCSSSSGPVGENHFHLHIDSNDSSSAIVEKEHAIIHSSNNRWNHHSNHNKRYRKEVREQIRYLVGDMGVSLFYPLDSFEDMIVSMDTEYNCTDAQSAVAASVEIADEAKEDSKIEGCCGDCDCWIDDCLESMMDLQACPRILSPTELQQLAKYFPTSCQGHRLERCFCIGLHGDSIVSMLHQCRLFRYTILVIQTTHGHVLGGFATANWNESKKHLNAYYGNGQSFLFASHPDGGDCSSSRTFSSEIKSLNIHEKSDDTTLSIFPWSGSNDYCQICDQESNLIAMGGEGDFGLIVRDNFTFGVTGYSRTYQNPPLVVSSGGRFDIASLEVYGIVPFSLYSSSFRQQRMA